MFIYYHQVANADNWHYHLLLIFVSHYVLDYCYGAGVGWGFGTAGGCFDYMLFAYLLPPCRPAPPEEGQGGKEMGNLCEDMH